MTSNDVSREYVRSNKLFVNQQELYSDVEPSLWLLAGIVLGSLGIGVLAAIIWIVS